MNDTTPPLRVISGPSPLTPELIEKINQEHDADGAAQIIRAINGVPEPAFIEGTNWAEVAMWLAFGAAAVAWILTHS